MGGFVELGRRGELVERRRELSFGSRCLLHQIQHFRQVRPCPYPNPRLCFVTPDRLRKDNLEFFVRSISPSLSYRLHRCSFSGGERLGSVGAQVGRNECELEEKLGGVGR